MSFIITSPESVGIPSESISSLLEELQENHVPVHSILIARYGKPVFETYFSPCKEDELHRMFSISKSFTSLAIGLLAEEQRLTLDDKIIQYFPEYIPEHPHPWLANMTIRDMLTMCTCHSSTTYKIDPHKNWVESFFTTKPTHPSGGVFLYDTSSSHTLCALVEKLTGMPMIEYLKEKVLLQIGCSKESYFLTDPFGTSMGGSGLMMSSRDLMRLSILIANHGRTLDGQQLIPESYLKEATSCQIDTQLTAPSLEESQGYGYQFWRTRHNGFACYGMGGQYAIFLPDYDLIFVTTADTQEQKGGNQLIFNAFYNNILPALSDYPLSENKTAQQILSNQCNQLSLPIVQGKITSELSSLISGRIFYLSECGLFDQCILQFYTDQTGLFQIHINDNWYKLPFGIGKLITGNFPIYNQRYAASGAWTAPNSFYFKCQLLDECVGSVHFYFSFSENQLSLFMKKAVEDSFSEFQGFVTGHL